MGTGILRGGIAAGINDFQEQLAILRRLARFTPADTVALSRTVARKCLELEKYPV